MRPTNHKKLACICRHVFYFSLIYWYGTENLSSQKEEAMDERMNRMAQQLGRNPAALRALMQSRDGQALMRMLTQQDQGASLQRAVQSAARGDTAEMAQMVQKLMQSPDGAELIDRINQATRK